MIAASTAIKWRTINEARQLCGIGANSYGAVVGDGVFDLGRRLGDRYPTLRAAIAGDALGAAAVEVRSGAPDIALSQVTLLPPRSRRSGGPQCFTRRRGEALHPDREPLEVLDRIRRTIGEYNFAGQYQQSPAPLGGGLVKAEWFNATARMNFRSASTGLVRITGWPGREVRVG